MDANEGITFRLIVLEYGDLITDSTSLEMHHNEPSV